MKTVLIYVNTSKDVGDVDHLKVFASEGAAEKWFAENDPEGVAFKYPVIGADEAEHRAGLSASRYCPLQGGR
jgi:hypothetical protein